MQILFGGTVFVTEGWALDSMSFLIVGSEIVKAKTAAVSNVINKVPGNYSPIIMESRREGSYIRIFHENLSRSDVRWSVFSTILDKDKIEYLNAAVSSILSSGTTHAAQALRDPFSIALDDERVANAIASVAEYFMAIQGRIIRTYPQADQFHNNFVTVLEDIIAADDSAKIENLLRLKASKFLQNIRNQRIVFDNSSVAMKYIEENCDESLRVLLFRAVNFSYMKVSSDLAKADVTTPALTNSPSEAERLVEAAIRRRTDRSILSTEQLFSIDVEDKNALINKLVNNQDWHETWVQAIQLSYTSNWKKNIEDLREMIVKYPNVDIDRRLIESRPFSKLRNMIESNIPSLSIRQSGFDRIVFALNRNLSISKDVTNQLMSAFYSGEGFVLASEMVKIPTIIPQEMKVQLSIPAAAIVALILYKAGPALANLIPKTIDLNPWSDKAFAWSHRITALDLVGKP
ncbi:MAG: hypothetical protein ABR878_02520 [Roseiarcus sp.]|jgi:hypothetical protein